MRWLVIAFLAACTAERPRPDGAPTTGSVHPVGISDPASDDFHGRELARRGWDLATCAGCHGDDFAGGAANVSCKSCHEAGPDACTTCHRDGAERSMTGAHASHRLESCAECHPVPARWDDDGHVRRGGVADPSPAEVTFGARAAQTLDPADRHGPPQFADGTCANVYCHGDVLHAGGGNASRPRWDATPIGGCASCHGKPPPSHAQDRCDSCHPANRHLDGVVQIGRAPGCNGCHGDAGSPAPPVDLSGNTFTTAIGVGAHRAHLDAPSRLRGPIACETCHRVPGQLFEAGHLDTPAPAEVTASLGWDRASRTCGAWCHGPARPDWTKLGGASCGSCHGVPPASHAPGPLTSCATCHPRTIDASGAIILTGSTSEHIDGDVDVF